jgi:hypothetical protein
MRLGLMRIAVGFALLLLAPVATAEDGGVGDVDAGEAPVVVAPDASLVDGAILACDGALCETQTGTTCALAGGAPGRVGPSWDAALAVLGGLALVGLRRRSGRARVRVGRSPATRSPGRSALIASVCAGQ